MRRIVLARHAETDWNLRDALNGDPAVDVRLTERGRDQARALGRAVEDVDVVAHTAFARTRETAELAWPGAPRVVVAELNEIAYGSFEGTAWRDGYHEWVTAAGPRDECPGGGESRAAAIGRYVSGYRAVLAREEDTVAVVAHGMHVAYVLLALAGTAPLPVLPTIPPATAVVVDGVRFGDAVTLIEAWTREPRWP